MNDALRVGYLDAGAGIAGDMFLAAAIDAGLDPGELERAISALGLSGVELKVERVLRCGVSAVHVTVEDPHQAEPHGLGHGSARKLGDVLALLEQSGLPGEVVTRSAAAFRRLAEAEGRIHGMPAEEVHFHEVGAVDSLVDIVGAFVAVRALGLSAIYASPVPLGSGTVKTAHGTLPVPAPATLALLGEWPVLPGSLRGEAVTPTGALLLRELAGEWRPCPPLVLKTTGYGAGTRDDPDRPNVVRLLVGEAAPAVAPEGLPLVPGAEDEEIYVLEAHLDDMTAEWCGYLMEALLSAGARDAAVSPLQMKKGRPGWLVTAVAAPEAAEQVARAFLRESTTLGLRYRKQRRICLDRRFLAVKVRGQPVRVKVGDLAGERFNLAPEYEDCRRVASATGLPLKEVYALAQAEARRKDDAQRE